MPHNCRYSNLNKRMNRIRILLTAFAVGVTLQSATAQSVEQYQGLADYVYPANAPKSVAKPAYLPDGTAYLALSPDGKSIVKHATDTGREIETVLDLDNTRENRTSAIEGFTLSPDGSKLLIYNGKTMIYRRSFYASYFVYDFHSRILRPLSDTHTRQRAPLFSPDGRMVAFTADDNNIYIKKLDYDTQVAVTTDGQTDRIINGVPDWTYEEEFATDCSMDWAPDCLTLSYLKYDEAAVPAFTFMLYEGTCDPKPQYALYPGEFTYKYPVAGQPNSEVSLHSYDVETRKNKAIPLTDSRIAYIPRIAYAHQSDRLMVTTLNRDQNRMEIYSVNPRSGVSKSILTEQSDAWIEPSTYESVKYFADCFALLSARSGYTHLYTYTYAGAQLKQITNGDFDVTAYYGRDAKGCHYVQSTATGAINRVLSRIDPVKGTMTHISPATGTASAWFDPSMAYYTVNYSNSTTPPAYTLYSIRDKKIRVLEENAACAARYASAPQKEFITIPSADPSVMLNAYIIKPAGFDASKQYPLIINQYSGPGSQEVLDRWRMEWCQYYAMQGYVVMSVDPRGTGGRGRKFQTSVYRRLGQLETLDIQEAARWAGHQSYIDPSRMAITGWSYGGYQTLMAVTTGTSPFKAAVAIAPVTDWRFYDTVYTERYMLTPEQNDDNYRTSSPLTFAANLNCRLLIMHGTADDNVHLLNTMQYVSALQSAGRMCDMMLFPNMNHSINFCDARLTVYAKALDYFNNNL